MFDAAISDPLLTHAFEEPFSGVVILRVKSDGGRKCNAHAIKGAGR